MWNIILWDGPRKKETNIQIKVVKSAYYYIYILNKSIGVIVSLAIDLITFGEKSTLNRHINYKSNPQLQKRYKVNKSAPQNWEYIEISFPWRIKMQFSKLNALRSHTFKKACYFCFYQGYPKLLDHKCLFFMYYLLIHVYCDFSDHTTRNAALSFGCCLKMNPHVSFRGVRKNIFRNTLNFFFSSDFPLDGSITASKTFTIMD